MQFKNNINPQAIEAKINYAKKLKDSKFLINCNNENSKNSITTVINNLQTNY